MNDFLGHTSSAILHAIAQHCGYDSYEIEMWPTHSYLAFTTKPSRIYESGKMKQAFGSVNYVICKNSQLPHFVWNFSLGFQHDICIFSYKATFLKDLDPERRQRVEDETLKMILNMSSQYGKCFGVKDNNSNFISFLHSRETLESLVMKLELECLV